jgi:hypothetical protein
MATQLLLNIYLLDFILFNFMQPILTPIMKLKPIIVQFIEYFS